jgi:hypothetical protein
MDDHHFGYIIKLTTPQKSTAILYCGGPIQLLKWDDEELTHEEKTSPTPNLSSRNYYP